LILNFETSVPANPVRVLLLTKDESMVKSTNDQQSTEEQSEGIINKLASMDPVAPRDFKVWAFAHLWKLSEVVGLRQVKQLTSLIFVELAPSVPVSLRRSITGSAGPHAAIIGAAITLNFALIVPILWTLAIGRFYKSGDPGIINLSQDWVNLVLYSTICPLYVGLGGWLVVVVIEGWGNINEYANSLKTPREKPSLMAVIKVLFLGVLILSVSLFSMAGYISDITKTANVPQLYWFMEATDAGEHRLGALGIYYALLNFLLLISTLISVTSFMSIFVTVMDVGNALETKTRRTDARLTELEEKLKSFTEAYILTKLLAVVYMINFSLWKSSPLGATQNIYVAFFFLTMFGVMFVSLPRYFVELQWYRFLRRTNQVKPEDDIYKDIRPFWMRVVASVLDSLIIGGFIVGTLWEFISTKISR